MKVIVRVIPSFNGHFSWIWTEGVLVTKESNFRHIRSTVPSEGLIWSTYDQKWQNIEAIHYFCYCNIVTNPYDTKNSWIKFCWTYPGFKGRSVIRPSSFRYKAIWWPYNWTYGLITDTRPWPYKSRSSRFFKTLNGLVSDTRPWPYNRANQSLSSVFIWIICIRWQSI